MLGLIPVNEEEGIIILETKSNNVGKIAAAIESYDKKVIVHGEKIGIGKPKDSFEVKNKLSKMYKIVVEKGNFLLGHN